MFAAGDTESVTIVAPVGRDEFGDPVDVDGVDRVVTGCIFAPGPSAESLVGANQVATDGTVYAPPGTDVAADSVIRVRGVDYQVDGQPLVWLNACVEIRLRRTEG